MGDDVGQLYLVTRNDSTGLEEVVGYAEGYGNLPRGFRVVEGEWVLIEEAYLDSDGVVQKRPEKAKGDEEASWNPTTNEWETMAKPRFDAPDWDGLTDALNGSPAFSRCYFAALQYLPVTTNFFMVMTVITSTRHLPSLQQFMGLLQIALRSTSSGDFSKSELEFVNGLLTKYHMGFQLETQEDSTDDEPVAPDDEEPAPESEAEPVDGPGADSDSGSVGGVTEGVDLV